MLEAVKPDLVVLDPLLAFCGGGNVNDNAVMALVMRALKRLANKFDCAILSSSPHPKRRRTRAAPSPSAGHHRSSISHGALSPWYR